MGRKRLLIVEDSEVQFQLLAAGLKGAGYDVVVARDGVQSISLVRQQRPDLILLDIELPAGGGYLVLERLKSLGVPLPVIAMSARPAEKEREKMLAAGADDYFEKPIEFERLTKRIQELLGD